jgi:flagellar M-ring protein FliF
MSQWKKILASFSTRQRVAILLAVAIAGAGLWALTRWRRETDFRPLYTALEADDAAAMVSRLKETGVEYRLSDDGRTILAPSAKVAEARLSMAAAGLPKTGRIGFELFDGTNFLATEFAEHVNYARALEGELERSVMYLAAVERARIPDVSKDSVFLEARQPAKASVILKVRPGARLTPQNVVAVSHLVASAVEGLTPDAVSVLDMRGNLLSRPRRMLTADGTGASDGMLEFRQSVEKDLLAKIHATLEPLGGPEKFRASVSVDCDFSSGEQSEETFDPARSVMVTSQKTEDVSGAAGSSGVPGTASNLPRPTSRPGSSQTGLTRRTENITYQSSRVVRRMRLPLEYQRMSVAVVPIRLSDGKGGRRREVMEPPTPEQMKSIRDLVASDRLQCRARRSAHWRACHSVTLNWSLPRAPAIARVPAVSVAESFGKRARRRSCWRCPPRWFWPERRRSSSFVTRELPPHRAKPDDKVHRRSGRRGADRASRRRAAGVAARADQSGSAGGTAPGRHQADPAVWRRSCAPGSRKGRTRR